MKWAHYAYVTQKMKGWSGSTIIQKCFHTGGTEIADSQGRRGTIPYHFNAEPVLYLPFIGNSWREISSSLLAFYTPKSRSLPKLSKTSPNYINNQNSIKTLNWLRISFSNIKRDGSLSLLKLFDKTLNHFVKQRRFTARSEGSVVIVFGSSPKWSKPRFGSVGTPLSLLDTHFKASAHLTTSPVYTFSSIKVIWFSCPTYKNLHGAMRVLQLVSCHHVLMGRLWLRR